MDITRLLAGISGYHETKDVRLVELKIGQAVRGVLLKMLSEQEGMVSIAGVPVRARLETPLRPGEATWLVVQPESSVTEIVLRPLSGSEAPMANRSAAELLAMLGLENTGQNRQLVQLMHETGLPMDRETVQAVLSSAAQKPEGANLRQWLLAVSVAVGKGIPVTGESVRALHAALFGKPAGETLKALQQALSGWLDDESARAGASPGSFRTALRLAELLDQALRFASGRLENPAPDPASATGRGIAPAGRVFENAPLSAAHAPARPQNAPAAGGQSAAPAGSAAWPGDGRPEPAPASAGLPTRPVPSGGTLRNGGHPADAPSSDRNADAGADRAANHRGAELLAGRLVPKTAPSVSRPERQAARGSEVLPKPLSSVRQAAASTGHASGARPEASGTSRPEPWLQTLFRDLGFDHEHRLLERLTMTEGIDEWPEGMRETVKGHVLTLLNDPQLPPALKETLQQTLQAITGQQLLMTADQRAPFSVVTLTVPLPGQSGKGESATVEIHARRSKGEPLDSANCRLLFDLNLARLGNLLMDVQVVDRMVSVRILSDHPAAETLVSESRQEAEEALAGIGYRLLSLVQAPYPKAAAGENPPSATEAASGAGTVSAAVTFGRIPYRGVDLRI